MGEIVMPILDGVRITWPYESVELLEDVLKDWIARVETGDIKVWRTNSHESITAEHLRIAKSFVDRSNKEIDLAKYPDIRHKWVALKNEREAARKARVEAARQVLVDEGAVGDHRSVEIDGDLRAYGVMPEIDMPE